MPQQQTFPHEELTFFNQHFEHISDQTDYLRFNRRIEFDDVYGIKLSSGQYICNAGTNLDRFRPSPPHLWHDQSDHHFRIKVDPHASSQRLNSFLFQSSTYRSQVTLSFFRFFERPQSLFRICLFVNPCITENENIRFTTLKECKELRHVAILIF